MGTSAALGEARRKHLPAAQRKLILEHLQARLSIEAFAREVVSNVSGMTGELAQRDNAYYWRWS